MGNIIQIFKDRQMKNILLVMPYGSVGGMERLALNFYQYYKKTGYNVKAVKFIGLSSDIITFGGDEYILSKKDLYEYSLIKRIFFYFSIPYKLRRIIRKEKITHSISFGDMANIYSSLTYTKEKKTGSIHALKSVELNTGSFFSSLIKYSYKTVYKKIDKVVCISYAIKEDLLKKCDYKFESNLDIIYNPHDIEKIKKLAKENITDEAESAIFKKDVILFLGRFSIQKSPWHLINAFSQIKNKNANLVFIGDGEEAVKEYIKTQIKILKIENKVFFLGRKSNPYKFLAKAKVLALSSHYEGTPNVIVEANALKIPVVSSNCTNGISELMSLSPEVLPSDDNILVEGGIITPNLYKGTLGVPSKQTASFMNEELKFAQAIDQVFLNNEIIDRVATYSELLTNKFEMSYVCDKYLK